MIIMNETKEAALNIEKDLLKSLLVMTDVITDFMKKIPNSLDVK